MNVYNLKQTVFLKSFRWTWRKQLIKRWGSFVKKLKMCPSKSEDDYQSVSRKSFHLRKLTSGRADFSFDYPAGKHLPNSEIVLFNQLRNIQKFITIFFFKRSFGHVEVSFDNREEKCLPKVGFYRSMSQIDFTNGRLDFCFSKISSEQVEWNTGLTSFAENCFLEVQKLFDRSRKNFTKLQFLISIFSRKCFAGLVAINFLTLPIKVCQIPKMFPSNFVVHYCEFLSKK